MNGTREIIEELSQRKVHCFALRGGPFVEPMALAGLALVADGQTELAQDVARWMIKIQSADGSLGISESHRSPRWPTSLAMLLWKSLIDCGIDDGNVEAVERAKQSILGLAGEAFDDAPFLGHDTKLVGWPWVQGTHSWIEPTAFAMLALKAVGQSAHARTREAVRLLFDRQLSEGGYNYGNTLVLGQELRAHLQPTGIVAVALADEPNARDRLQPTLSLLTGQVDRRTGTPSLCWTLMGLAAHDLFPAAAPKWIDQCASRRTLDHTSSYKLALLALASMGTRSPLIPRGRK